MATVNALSVALFNAAAGGYAAEMTANAAGFANAVGPILEKDVSTDALFVDHLLGNLGVTSTNAVYSQAKAAVAALVTTKGRAGAASDAVDFLKAQEGSTSAYATIAANFAAKVNAAAAFTAANATERDITKLISGVTGVDTDAAAIAAATAAVEAAATTAAAAAAAKAAADLAAANAAAEAAATKAAADLAAANAAATAAAEAAAAKAAADLATANATITSLQNPVGKSLALTSSTTPDVLIGTAGADTYTGTTATLATTDIIVDPSTTDSDTFNLAATTSVSAFIVANVENINVTISAVNGTNPTVDAANFSGVTKLTVTGSDVSVGGTTIAGDKDIIVNNVTSSKVASVVAGAGTKAVTVVQATTAGVTVDASTATGAQAITGAATLNADKATGAVTFTALGDTTEDAKPIVVNAALSSGVTTAIGFTGEITVNAAKASTITLNNAESGATVNAGTTSTADTTIAIDGISDLGATITTGTGYNDSVVTTLKSIAINLNGSGDVTDAATVAAAGYISLDANAGTDLVETVNLSGTTGAVTYKMVTSAPDVYNLTGTQSVTVSNTAAAFDGDSLKDATTGGTTTAKVTTVATADLSGILADVIEVSDAGTSAALTIKTGANVVISSDQTTGFSLVGKTTSTTVTLTTADDTAASGAPIDISVGAFASNTNITTTNLVASVGSFTATGTTLKTTGVLNISGESDVALGTMVAGKTINAAGSTGKISLNTGTTNTTLKTITTGSGDDTVTTDTDAVYTLNLGDGANTLTIDTSGASDGSSYSTGAGDDTVTINDASSIVVVTGAGNDTVTLTVASDAVMNFGDGTADSLVLPAQDFKALTNFNYSGVEKVTAPAAGTATISAAQFAVDNVFQLLGTSATADILTIVNNGSTGTTIDASGVTFATSQNAKLVLQGLAAKADVITGSAKVDYIIGSTGADIVTGGAGSDTYDAGALATTSVEGTGTGTSVGVVINLGTTAVTNTSALSKTGSFTANSITSIESGKTAYLFASAASTNSAVQQSLSTIENLVGTTGNDYLVGNTSANTLTGDDGADYLVGGLGDDNFVFATGDTGITLATADTISDFATASDSIVTSLVAGNATKADGTALADFAAFITAANAVLTAGAGVNDAYIAWNAAGTGDAWVVIDEDDSGSVDAGDTVIILTGVNLAAEVVIADIK